MPPNDPTPDLTPTPRGSAEAPERARGGSDPAVAGRRKRRRVVRLGVGDEDPGRGAEYTEVGWHEAAGDSTNDEQLKRDVPPHW